MLLQIGLEKEVSKDASEREVQKMDHKKSHQQWVAEIKRQWEENRNGWRYQIILSHIALAAALIALLKR